MTLVLLIGSAAGARAQAQALDTIDITVRAGTMLSADVTRDGRILFDLFGQLWLLPPGGGAAVPLTDAVADTAEDQDPAFSPDGRFVGFMAERAGRRGLWLVDVEAQRVRQLVQLPEPESFAGHAAWSPDGNTIAFARVFPEDTVGGERAVRIALLDVASGMVRPLAVSGGPAGNWSSPAWSPDGARIAFVNAADDGMRIWWAPARGGEATPLTTTLSSAHSPAFSPDGRRLAFLATDSRERWQVWVQDLAVASAAQAGTGGGERAARTGEVARAARITNEAELAPTRVRWLDGETLLYSASGALRRMAPDGSRVSDVPFSARLSLVRPSRTLPPVALPEPGQARAARGFTGLALAPDAGTIGMIALGKLWLVPVGGGAPRALADVPHTARHVAWSPDGGEIAWSAGLGDHLDVFTTTVATGATRRITALPGRELYPAFSPDGRQLAFVHELGEAQLRVIAADEREVRDTLRTRSLGPASASWIASSAFAPLWSPQSDALLVPGMHEARAELVPLSGARRELPLPAPALFAGWSRRALTWVRHDRLWRASFTDSVGPAEALGEAPALYASTSPDGTVLFVSADGLRLRTPAGMERNLGWPLQYTPPAAPPLLIRNARIIDGTGAAATTPRDLLIERGRITRIEAAGILEPADARVLDARGGFVIPGLMDLHAHAYWPEVLPGFLHFGVTLVRDQGSAMAPIAAFADAVAAGVVPGPRVLYGGFQYYSDWAFDDEEGRGIEPEVDPQHVTRAIALARAFGAQHVKTRTFRRWDINARMIAEAARHGLRATGHCALQLPLIAAGIGAKEHAGVCASRGAGSFFGDQLQNEDASALMRAAGIGFVPTISYFAFAARLNEQPRLLEEDAELAPFLLDAGSFGWMLRLDSAGRARHTRAAADARASTVRAVRAGVTVGTGTDIWQVPTGAHMELEELVAAGLSPLEAIHAATLASARIAGVERDLGSVEVGKLADLVILEADPGADIRNTRRIREVIQGGRVVDRAMIREQYGTRSEPRE